MDDDSLELVLEAGSLEAVLEVDSRVAERSAVDPRVAERSDVDPRAPGRSAVDPRAPGRSAVDSRAPGRSAVDSRVAERSDADDRAVDSAPGRAAVCEADTRRVASTLWPEAASLWSSRLSSTLRRASCVLTSRATSRLMLPRSRWLSWAIRSTRMPSLTKRP